MSSENRSTNGSGRRGRRRPFGRVCKRPNGDLYIQFIEPGAARGPDGRRRVTTRSVTTKAEGEALLKEIRLAILRGCFLAACDEPLKTLVLAGP